MPIIETEQQTNQNVISGQEYLDAGATRELAGQLQGYAIGYDEGYDAGAAAGGGGSGSGGGSATAYAWTCDYNDDIYTNFDTAPASAEDALRIVMTFTSPRTEHVHKLLFEGDVYTKISDTEFQITYIQNGQQQTNTYRRDSVNDFTLWQLPE